MRDIVDKLREVEKFKPGDPLPTWATDWGTYLSGLAGEAANEIERLRKVYG